MGKHHRFGEANTEDIPTGWTDKMVIVSENIVDVIVKTVVNTRLMIYQKMNLGFYFEYQIYSLPSMISAGERNSAIVFAYPM